MLTDKKFYNIGDEGLKDSMISWWRSSPVKRAINIEDIKYITYSLCSSQFVIHILKEYDYLLSNHENRNHFIYY